MRILLDTHIYLWCVKNDHHLSKKLRSIILDATEVYVSSVSIWEVAIKTKLGKLNVNLDELADTITQSGFLELPVTVKHASQISKLPDVHRDPFDRMLIAQAISEPLILLTADSILQEYTDLVKLV